MFCKDCIHGAPMRKFNDLRWCEVTDKEMPEESHCDHYDPIDL
jgi:hypothetical protein